jgi:hypothetical protein
LRCGNHVRVQRRLPLYLRGVFLLHDKPEQKQKSAKRDDNFAGSIHEI